MPVAMPLPRLLELKSFINSALIDKVEDPCKKLL
jgi:hypothetical protein